VLSLWWLELETTGVTLMARTKAELTTNIRLTDFISLGVIAKTIPLSTINHVLNENGKASQRQRDFPAHVVVYYVIALALHMQVSYREVYRFLIEGLRWLSSGKTLKVTGKSAISQARTRLGSDVLEQLHERIVKPIAQESTKGAWYRKWRLISIDGSTMDTADEQRNLASFGRHPTSKGQSGFPQIRFVSLVENGTHVLFGTRMGGATKVGEIELAKQVLSESVLTEGTLILADRYFYGFELWNQARANGADLLWRVKKNMVLPRETQLPDGSYLSRIYPSQEDQRRKINGVIVRVIEYTLEGIPDAEPLYRLMTTILDYEAAPAMELAAVYHERWEIETSFDELKTHLRGARIVLRSKTPDLVRQEFYGLLLAHFAIRSLMHEAALEADEDPDRISFIHSVRVVRRQIVRFTTISPSRLHSIS